MTELQKKIISLCAALRHNAPLADTARYALAALHRKFTAQPPLARLFLVLVLLSFILNFLISLALPRPLFNKPYSSILYDRNGALLGAKIAADQQWRFPCSSQVPLKYKQALLLYEDSRFYFHPGIDPFAVVRAALGNLRGGEIISGASTISMQVVRLSRKSPRRDYLNKLYETILTLGLEFRYSKNTILALYAGHAPFGGNVVGIEAASWRYFGRPAGDLSWAESALLAVLPNNPSLVHPGRNRERLRNKRDALLRKLHTHGAISATDLSLSLHEPLPDKPLALPRLAPHLLETLAAESSKPLYEKTSIDMSVQTRCNAIVQKHHETLRQRGIHNIAALVIDNETLEVLAYTGNIPSPLPETERELFQAHGYDIDLIRRGRSTGSILKPLLYAAMLHEGSITPESLVRDVPVHFDGFMPQNFNRSYSGVVRAKEALARSLNIPAVAMLRDYSYQRFYRLLKSAGMSTLFRPADGYGLTLIIGGAEGNLWEIASMYASLARKAMDMNCRYPSLYPGAGAQELKLTQISPGAAYLTLEALLEVERPGTDSYWRSFAYSQKIAWKTGTSLGQRDAWSAGVSKKYTVAVWAGNSDGEGVAGMTGLEIAAPVMFEIFSALPRSDWFTPPYHDLKQIEICAKSGFLATGLCETTQIYVPRASHVEKSCPYHTLIHTDQSGEYRVNGECWHESDMLHVSWFVLPPVEEYYYIMSGADYKRLPPLHGNCDKGEDLFSRTPMRLIYPVRNTSVFVPVDISGTRSMVVFKAAHRDPGAEIFWHIDEEYLGKTKHYHEITVQPQGGTHTLILVDDRGHSVREQFKVINEQE